ncbi:MAG TPA: hypothetical protein VHE54_18420 [Puia sp.]|nr:hypothetical protein [Puia sp.]
MAIRTHIRKVLTTVVWTIAGAGVLVLLVAAIRYRNSNTCKGWHVTIEGAAAPGARLFIDRKAITDLLVSAGADKGERRPIQSFDLRRLETTLKKDIWIKDAQLFFDNTGVLQVKVTGRTPVARIFTREGGSFYIDSTGVQLPLQDRFASRLPVFTGYPASRFSIRRQDSAISAGILQLSSFLRNDAFWMAQIAQVDITPGNDFELEPEIGNQRIAFGDAADIPAKFHRLYLFYSEVLSRVGMDKYDRIDVSYAGQVVGRLKGPAQNRIDTSRGIDNIRQMIRAGQLLQPDTARQQHTRPLEDHNTMTEQSLTNYDLVPDAGDSSATVPPARPAGNNAAIPVRAHTAPRTAVPGDKSGKPRAILPPKP